jgi:hypothetical protein
MPSVMAQSKTGDTLMTEVANVKREKVLSEAGKQVVFEVSRYIDEYAENGEFHWDFGDGGSAEGMGVLHSYIRPGYYEASLLLIDNGEEKKFYIDVYVYEKLFLGIVDQSVNTDTLNKLEQNIFNQGNLLWVLSESKEEDMVDVVLRNTDILNKTKVLFLWGSGNFSLDLLLQLKQRSELDFEKLSIVSASNQSFTSLKKTADSVFNLIDPNALILVKDNAVSYFEKYIDDESWMKVLNDEGIGYELIGVKNEFRSSPPSAWMLVSNVVNYALFRGVPLSTISMILMIPLIALLLAVARQVVGIKAFGIYVPALITLAFLESGLRYGTIVFLIILAVGTIGRLALKNVRILYLPRMAIILSLVALGMLLVMYLAAYFDVTGLKTLSIVPLLTMIILTEKFVSAQIRYGFGAALKLTTETFILSALCYLLVSWQTLEVLIISYPEVVLLTIPFLIILGRWSGLRLGEYWRFRRLIGK